MPRGGAGRGQGRKLPPGKDPKIEKTWMIRPDLAAWVKDMARESGCKSESEYIERVLERERIEKPIV